MTSNSVEIEDLFSPVLQPDERLLWTGRPRAGSFDHRYLLGMIWGGVGVCFIGFLLAMTLAAWTGGSSINVIGLLYLGMTILLLAICLTMLITSWHRFSRPGRQSYAVTNKRLIFHDRGHPQAFESQLLRHVSNIWRTGSGNVMFGTAPHELFFSISNALKKPPSDRFINIPDSQDVERIILGAASK